MSLIDPRILEAHLRRCMDAYGERPREQWPREMARAAVATVIRYNPEPQVLLIKRSERPGDPWSGHMAFPGGRSDPEDRDSRATAERETREEVDLDLRQWGDYMGPLLARQAVARGRRQPMVIEQHVYVAEAHAEPGPAIDPKEVAATYWAPLQPFFDGTTDTTLPYEMEGRRLKLPGYQFGPNVVWGLTYFMLYRLFELLREGDVS